MKEDRSMRSEVLGSGQLGTHFSERSKVIITTTCIRVTEVLHNSRKNFDYKFGQQNVININTIGLIFKRNFQCSLRSKLLHFV
jgi:hypothetical protein